MVLSVQDHSLHPPKTWVKLWVKPMRQSSKSPVYQGFSALQVEEIRFWSATPFWMPHFSPLNDPFLFYSIIIYILVILLYDTISRLEISLHRLTAAAGITVRVRPWQSERINRYDMTDTMILAALLLILATGYLQTAQRNFR